MRFDNSKPIYVQITDMLKAHMITGTWAGGHRVPPVRDLALSMGVNPNTMQKALGLLEQENLLYTERTSGRFVTENQEVLAKMKQDVLSAELARFFKRMAELGLPMQEVKMLVQRYEAPAEEGENAI